MRVMHTILDLIFPASCLSCHKKGVDFCASCLLACPPASRECASWIFPLYDYRHLPIRQAIQFLKYKNKKRIAGILARVLYRRILEELADLSRLENFREPLLIPIPLSTRRLRERGFNQVLLLGKKLSKLDKEKNFQLVKNVLFKSKETPHQARIEARQKRLENIRGSFSVRNADKIKNRNILLLDDVVTTGATLTEAKKILREAGARKIIAFTLAH
jgi:ComF family protein